MWWRDRTIRILLLLAAGVLLLAWGARTKGFGIKPLGYVCSTLYAPLDWTADRLGDAVEAASTLFKSKYALQRQLSRLERERADSQVLAQKLAEVERENLRLKQLLQLPVEPGFRQRAARVTGRSVTNLYQTLRIDAGAEAGLSPGDPVMAGEGLVGQILSASLFSSTVLLLTDSNSGVAVISAKHRANGVVKGTGGEVLLLDYVAGSDLLEPGETVLTSGLGGVYPKGLPIGSITAVEPNPITHVKRATVVPFVDFSKLEEVTVLVPVQRKQGS